MKKNGYTMTELLITLTIITILAGLAIPAYQRTVELSRRNEAITTLNVIHMGEKIFRINNGTFWDGGNNATVAAIDTALNVDIVPQYYDDIDFSAVSAAGYTCRATRNTSSGGSTTWWVQVVGAPTGAPTQTQNP